MKRTFDLSELEWQVAGYDPHEWRREKSMEIVAASEAAIPAVPAAVPGSVQKALLDAGLLPDWNIGLNARHCEWVENRHWIYETAVPDEWFAHGKTFRLRCLGLDYCGCIRLNGEELYRFKNTHLTHVVDLTPCVAESGNILQIIFECPPRWLGTPNFTSQIREWKPRFNYTWDWIPRLVQIGIWDRVLLEAVDDGEIESLRTLTDVDLDSKTGRLSIDGKVSGADDHSILVELEGPQGIVRREDLPLPDFLENGLTWESLDIALWWPNGSGDQPLYDLRVVLLDAAGQEADRIERRVGFKDVRWEQCEGAPEGADPWLCVVNGRPVFLQGVNWSPIRPNFADVPEAEYRKRLQLYHDLNMNVLRVNGCGILEKEFFYDICDELGLLIWQDFPLSSSGPDNTPPGDEESVAEMAEIVASYVPRRQHHVSLLMWCGGNELQSLADGSPGIGVPLDFSHPMLERMRQVAAQLDPGRRFVPTSASGPTFYASHLSYGQGIHWDVHGPWKVEGRISDWKYWEGDDALFRSEVGAPGPSSVEIIRRYKGDCEEVPGTLENPLWRRTSWWIEWPQFVEEHGREPRDLEEYVAWGQERQAQALRMAAEACKGRFPGIGGMILWMGHDCFPCTSNTAIIDFEGNPKPAALALGEVFGGPD